MAKNIDSDAEITSIRLDEQTSAPSPDTGYSHVFAKADGLYIVDDDDAVTGPFTASVASGVDIYTAEVLYDVTLGSAGTFDAVTIPDDIVNVEAILTGRSDRAGQVTDNIDIILNGDTTTANYIRAAHFAGETHDDATLADNVIGSLPAATASSGYWGELRVWIPHVKWDEKHPVSGQGTSIRSSTNRYLVHNSCLWTTETAITSVRLSPDLGSNFTTGSRLQILGYKEIEVGAGGADILEIQVFS